MKKSILSFVVFVLFALGFAASNEDGNAKSMQQTEQKKGAEVEEETEKVEEPTKSIYEIRDIEELRKALNNTVWTHTENGDRWLRFEFIGNKIKQYSAIPKDRSWQYDGESQYTLSEYCTQYDGRKFFIATFRPLTESLAIFDLDVVFNFEDYHLYLNGQNIGGFVKDDYKFD